MKNTINSRIYLWSGIFSGILAVVLYILLKPGIDKKQHIKPATSKYIDLSTQDNKHQEIVSRPKKHKSPTSKKDDLTVIKGIGPKIEALLNKNDIFSFEDLSHISVEKLTTLMLENNLRLANPQTWPKDAKSRIE